MDIATKNKEELDGTIAEMLLHDCVKGVYSDASVAACQEELECLVEDICERFEIGSVERFRRFLERAKAVVSGSNGVLAFHPGLFKAGDLDIYVPVVSIPIVNRFMRRHEYYPTYGPLWYTPEIPSIRTVRKFMKGTKSIDIIYSWTNSAIQVVAEFHSTAVMNYIAHFGAVSMYPRATLAKVAIMNSAQPKAIACRRKYEERGFRFADVVGVPGSHNCKSDFLCPSTIRSIHDAGVLFVPFKAVDGKLSEHEGNLCWRLNNNTCQAKGKGFTIGESGEAEPSWYEPVTMESAEYWAEKKYRANVVV